MFPIAIPPLRAHKQDIPLLVDHYLTRFRIEFGKPNLKISPVSLEFMTQYDWLGNVRELQNIIQRAALLCVGETIEPEHLPKELSEGKVALPEAQGLREVERSARDNAARYAISKVLEQTGWSVKESAKILGIPEKTLYDRCKKLDIKLSKKK